MGSKVPPDCEHSGKTDEETSDCPFGRALQFDALQYRRIGTRSGKVEVPMVEIQPIRVEIEREEDGRILASVPDLSGVMAYGSTEDEAIRKVKSIALQVFADMIESRDYVPDPLKMLFAA